MFSPTSDRLEPLTASSLCGSPALPERWVVCRVRPRPKIFGASLWFNLWSRKQHIIDDLAEDIAWAINNLLNRSPTPSTPQTIAAWEADFRSWCDRVSRKLENRAFFTRADQLHFDVLGFIQPIAVAGHAVGLAHLESQLNEKLKRLRDVINWTQQRRR